MKVDLFHTSDYDEVKSWWEMWGIDPIEPKYLGQGFIVKGHCAIFVYPTGTPICFLENLIANKDLDKQVRNTAVDLLIGSVLMFLKSKKVEIVNSISRIDAVTSRAFEKHNFKVSEENYRVLTNKLT